MLSYHLSSKSVYGGPCKSKTNLCGSIILGIPVQCLEISFKMFLSLVMFRLCLVTLWTNVRYAWDCLQVLHAFPSLHVICTHECWIWAWEVLYKVNKKNSSGSGFSTAFTSNPVNCVRTTSTCLDARNHSQHLTTSFTFLNAYQPFLFPCIKRKEWPQTTMALPETYLELMNLIFIIKKNIW